MPLAALGSGIALAVTASVASAAPQDPTPGCDDDACRYI
jgi:hypothetical protein